MQKSSTYKLAFLEHFELSNGLLDPMVAKIRPFIENGSTRYRICGEYQHSPKLATAQK